MKQLHEFEITVLLDILALAQADVNLKSHRDLKHFHDSLRAGYQRPPYEGWKPWDESGIRELFCNRESNVPFMADLYLEAARRYTLLPKE